jgi:hypothetical protein
MLSKRCPRVPLRSTRGYNPSPRRGEKTTTDKVNLKRPREAILDGFRAVILSRFRGLILSESCVAILNGFRKVILGRSRGIILRGSRGVILRGLQSDFTGARSECPTDPGGVTECSHGWSEAEPVDLSYSTRAAPEGRGIACTTRDMGDALDRRHR